MGTAPEIKEAQAKAIAEWWAEKMQKPMNWNNGDDSSAGGLAFALGNLVSMKAQGSITPQKVEIFKSVLVKSILDNYDDYHVRNLDVDYHPCTQLAYACKLADIDPGALPCKSSTSIDKTTNKVYSRYQYGSDFIVIYEPK